MCVRESVFKRERETDRQRQTDRKRQRERERVFLDSNVLSIASGRADRLTAVVLVFFHEVLVVDRGTVILSITYPLGHNARTIVTPELTISAIGWRKTDTKQT